MMSCHVAVFSWGDEEGTTARAAAAGDVLDEIDTRVSDWVHVVVPCATRRYDMVIRSLNWWRQSIWRYTDITSHWPCSESRRKLVSYTFVYNAGVDVAVSKCIVKMYVKRYRRLTIIIIIIIIGLIKFIGAIMRQKSLQERLALVRGATAAIVKLM